MTKWCTHEIHSTCDKNSSNLGPFKKYTTQVIKVMREIYLRFKVKKLAYKLK